MTAEDPLWEMFQKEAADRTALMLEHLTAIEEGSDPEIETLTTLHREAHTIKGAAGVIGRPDIYETAEPIESQLREAKDSGSLEPAAATSLIQATHGLISQIQGR